MSQAPNIHNLGALKASGYTHRSVKNEIRDNLIPALESGKELFPGIHGYDDTVIPELTAALLAKHNVILLGLRGQAKTRIIRSLVSLLDEWMPVLAGLPLREDPLAPISDAAKLRIAKSGDATPIEWVHRSARYAEKLATPDVTIADLIGDIDPVRAINEKLELSNEDVIHFGIIPRSNRGIFAVNELPDLQPRIQVGLFNLLEENDIQIRGFPLRLPLDVLLVFTANPEDYTNRGSIVTPLKDRIGSQIMTHYPRDLDSAKAITIQEAELTRSGRVHSIPWPILDIIEYIAMEARESEFVDQSSGVSARMTISLLDLLISSSERRRFLTHDKEPDYRLVDLFQSVPAITGKLELVYEGEREGPQTVAKYLIGKGIRRFFTKHLPDPLAGGDSDHPAGNPYHEVVRWFGGGKSLDFSDTLSHDDYVRRLKEVPGAEGLIRKHLPELSSGLFPLLTEIILEGLHQCSMLSKKIDGREFTYREMLNFAMQRR